MPFTNKTMDDLVVIGVAYIEGGLRKYPAWSERMLQELGEPVRPHLLDIYSHAFDAFAGVILEETESLAYEVKILRRRLEQSDKDLTTAISGTAITPTRGMTRLGSANADASRLKLSPDARRRMIASVRERLSTTV